MTTMGAEEIQKLIQDNPHLKTYLENVRKKIGDPIFYSKVPREVRDDKFPNLIYATKGLVFIHIFRTQDMEEVEYRSIEPILTDNEKEKHKQILKIIVKKVPEKDSVKTDDELKKVLQELIDEITIIDESAENAEVKKGKGLGSSKEKVRLTTLQKKNIEYYIIKDLVGGGPIECFMRDPYIEDIHFVAGENVHLIHKVFQMIKTNIVVNQKDAPDFCKMMSEKMGNPVSEGRPIIDGVLPDGSRGNIIFSKAISIKGPSMTIRRFTETPISVTQLIQWNTLSSGIASYLWLCLQYGRAFSFAEEQPAEKQRP